MLSSSLKAGHRIGSSIHRTALLLSSRNSQPKISSRKELLRYSLQSNQSCCLTSPLGISHNHFDLQAFNAIPLRATSSFSTKTQKSSNSSQISYNENVTINNNVEDFHSKKLQILQLAKSDEKNCMDKAVRIFQEIIRQFKEKGTTTEEKPSVECLEALLKSLVTHSLTGDAKSAALLGQSLFSDMVELSELNNEPDMYPSAKCYRDLIALWARAKNPEQAERLFWELLLPKANLPNPSEPQEKRSNCINIEPNKMLSPSKAHRALLGQSLNQILEAWAKSGKEEAGKRCDDLLSQLGRMKLPKGITVSPNPLSFDMLWVAHRKSLDLAARSKADPLHPKYFAKVARRVQGIIDFRMQRYQSSKNPEWLPEDPECYPWLIQAWCHAGAPDKAQQVLEAQIKYSNIENRVPPPNAFMYNCVLEGWGCKGKPQEAALLLSKWVSRCQNYLESTGQTPEEASDHLAMPDHDSCMLVIRAWGQFSEWDYASKAELILDRMLELQNTEKPQLRVLPAPTVDTYNALLEAWSISKHHKIAKACTNVERILEAMHSHSDMNRRPNERAYELVIETYARFGYKLYHRKKRVQKLARQMKHFGYTPSDRILDLVELCQEQDKRLP